MWNITGPLGSKALVDWANWYHNLRQIDNQKLQVLMIFGFTQYTFGVLRLPKMIPKI